MEQSVKELGLAFSGAPTNTEDGSMVFFNPGAMGQMHGSLVSLSGHLIVPSSTFKDRGSHMSPLLGGTPLRGGSGGDAGGIALIPTGYYVRELAERWVVGLGVNTPFGVHNDYQPDWKGRYQAIGSELITVNVNPALAFRVTDSVSFGAGLNIQYLRATLTNAIDFGTICFKSLGPLACASGGLMPQEADGRVAVKGDSIGLGYNLGLFYQPYPNTRLGVSYRSKIDQRLKGQADFSMPAAAMPLTVGDSFVDTDIRASVSMPESVTLGFYQRVHPQWAFTGDALWTRWSRIKELRTEFASAQADSVQRMDWRDTWRYAMGISYYPDSAWTFRTGLAYDQTPVPDARRRTPRIPDNDRIWLTAGISYRFSDNFVLHGAYAHLFLADPRIDSQSPTGDRLIGQYSAQIDIVSLQLDCQF